VIIREEEDQQQDQAEQVDLPVHHSCPAKEIRNDEIGIKIDIRNIEVDARVRLITLWRGWE